MTKDVVFNNTEGPVIGSMNFWDNDDD
jgi:hypothetical protein